MTKYYEEYSRSEIRSMFGMDLEDELDGYEEDVDLDSEEAEEECCGRCMRCLGMSTSDFM